MSSKFCFGQQLGLLSICLLLLVGCGGPENKTETEQQGVLEPLVFNETYRPQYHFTPPTHWMNDPNGLVFHEGTYHLFYQYYPEDIVWGPMHWGHATSTDLIHWEHQPIALYPDELGLIFSGSAVVDHDNTSGFGSAETPAMVAAFTYHLMEGEQAGRKDFQTQGIAYSLDNGLNWTKYEGNPVIGNDGIKDFRDPKVFWHQETKQWIMVLVAGDHAKFYSSPDLKDWTYLSDFGQEVGAHGGVWECPDLFQLQIEGSEEKHWVLLISINPGAPNGGSGTQYFIGDFDGQKFTTDQTQPKWLDLGRDNYAGVTYNQTPDGKRIFIGWMSNWDYARSTPTEVWRSAMTLPRELTLHAHGDDLRVHSTVVEQLGSSKKEGFVMDQLNAGEAHTMDIDYLQESHFKFDFVGNESLELVLTNKSDSLFIDYDPVAKTLGLDRRRSGQVDFKENFAQGVQTYPLTDEKEIRSMEIYLDRSSIEVFMDDGRYVLTNQIFPNTPYERLFLNPSSEQQISNFSITPIKSIWRDE